MRGQLSLDVISEEKAMRKAFLPKTIFPWNTVSSEVWYRKGEKWGRMGKSDCEKLDGWFGEFGFYRAEGEGQTMLGTMFPTLGAFS